jgi:alcohol dehydrogenase
MPKMKAAVFVEPGRIVIDDKPVPDIGPLDALMRITTTTICGTDVHILKGEYPVERGLTIGHEPVGVIEKLGSAVEGFSEGQRVIAGAITPSGHSNACQCGQSSQDGPARAWLEAAGRLEVRQHHRRLPGRIRAGARCHGQSRPGARRLSDEQVLMCPDIMSTGFAGARTRPDPHRRHRRGVRARARSGCAPRRAPS